MMERKRAKGKDNDRSTYTIKEKTKHRKCFNKKWKMIEKYV